MEKIYNYLDIIFLVLIVIFLLFTLLRLFGKKTGYQGKKITTSVKFQVLEKVVNPSKSEDKEVTKVIYSEGSLDYKLMKIQEQDKNFEIKSFLRGAKKAFELIVVNYHKGNIKDIDAFITKDLKTKLSDYISNNPSSKIIQDIDFLITDIIDAEINNHLASLKVKFVTRQKISSEAKEVRENWTFCKDLNKNSTIWLLSKISNS